MEVLCTLSNAYARGDENTVGGVWGPVEEWGFPLDNWAPMGYLIQPGFEMAGSSLFSDFSYRRGQFRVCLFVWKYIVKVTLFFFFFIYLFGLEIK